MEIPMSTRFDDHDLDDALQSGQESGAPITAWSLDELDEHSDLESLRWALDHPED
jgi:hypothetical protein